MHNFSVVNDLCIGKVIEVQGTRVKIELDKQIDDLTRSHHGRVYSIGQMASILKIHFGRKILFIYVRLLRMNSDADEVENRVSDDDSRIIEADLLGEGTWSKEIETLNFSRGVELYPLPLQSVYLMTDNELDKLYSGAEKNVQFKSNSPLVKIGKYSGSNQDVRANINKLFGNHCAILGSTGSGKSGTTAAILHSVLEASGQEEGQLHPRILMIDPHGEYGKAFKDRAIIYNAYSQTISEDNAKEISLPYWLMTSDEFRALVIGKTEFEATSQNNIVYEALAYARMVNEGIIKRIENEQAIGGAEPELEEGKLEEERLTFDRDKPKPFKLEDFIFHIDNIQGRKLGEFRKLSQSAGRDKIDGILKKIRILRSNPQLNFILKEYEDEDLDLAGVVSQLIGKEEENKNFRIIDISGLPNEVAGLLTALISRLVFQYKLWQSRSLRELDPVLFVCEEAHKYVPNHGEAQYKEAQVAIRRIAKEGRKYGIGLMLISQRPSDLESTVLSQCNSWIVLRLTNANDQSYVSNFIPDSLSGLTTILPSLTRREAIFAGEAAAIPSRIKIRELASEKLPDSSDVDFIQGWENEQFSTEDIKKTTDYWVNNSNIN
ncbi:ATP-binding protein [Salibacterium aidingense]|uniref:ATP-binding protein n=1 Tax=Salibacterium aidingense TaxID=384933 RepID=UPI003BCA4D05